MKKKTKILITGSNGFVGKNLKFELQRKYDVYGLGRESKKEKKYFKINLKNKKKILKLFKEIKFDIVIHCAWYTNHKDYRNSKKNYEYLKISKFLLDSYIKYGGKNFIGLGTCEEYKKEKFSKNIFSEKTKIEPINLYAKTKNLFHKYLKNKKINYKWLRIFYLFGQGENNKRLLPLIMISANKKLNFKLKYPYFKTDFIYIKTLSKIISRLINKKINGDFNICRGKSIKLCDILKIIDKDYKKINKQLVAHKKGKLDHEEIKGSVNKIKKINCYVKSDFKKDIKKYFKSFKYISP